MTGLISSCLLIIGMPGSARAQQNMDMELTDLSTPEFNAMGFGDISYVSRDSDDPDGFAIGQAVAHLSASLGGSFGVFGEFSLTAKDNEYTPEVERFIVKYDFSDILKLSAGRYHTPIGYWNTAFHHGAWLQTTTMRPEFVKFGSQIVPIHFVGALLEGNLTQNSLGLSYKAGFGNGRHSNIARAGDTGDVNGDNAWMVEINASPDNLYGLKAGIGYYQDLVTQSGEPDINEEIYSGYIAWVKERPEFIAEFLHSIHTVATDSSDTGDTNAWYAQFAWRLDGRYKHWKPYARYERDTIDDSDPLLGDQGLDYNGTILGIRWDFNPYAALKGEYRNEEFNNGGRENNFQLQVAFVLAKL